MGCAAPYEETSGANRRRGSIASDGEVLGVITWKGNSPRLPCYPSPSVTAKVAIKEKRLYTST